MNKNRIPQVESHMIDVQPESFLLFPEMEISSTAEPWVKCNGQSNTLTFQGKPNTTFDSNSQILRRKLRT